uniref:2Fe-2S ferredoxin-type domain-containing protein n=1 Tax=Cannabis sativa TaxID=3483 RepID=A0A803NMB2_CANSA
MKGAPRMFLPLLFRLLRLEEGGVSVIYGECGNAVVMAGGDVVKESVEGGSGEMRFCVVVGANGGREMPKAGNDGSYPVERAKEISGEKLLRNIMADNKIQLYATYGKVMNCGGGGSCGTCIVEILDGKDLLNERTNTELKYLKKKPESWRLACQTIVGNKENSGKWPPLLSLFLPLGASRRPVDSQAQTLSSLSFSRDPAPSAPLGDPDWQPRPNHAGHGWDRDFMVISNHSGHNLSIFLAAHLDREKGKAMSNCGLDGSIAITVEKSSRDSSSSLGEKNRVEREDERDGIRVRVISFRQKAVEGQYMWTVYCVT